MTVAQVKAANEAMFGASPIQRAVAAVAEHGVATTARAALASDDVDFAIGLLHAAGRHAEAEHVLAHFNASDPRAMLDVLRRALEALC
jgi:hypothetical protein